VARLQGVSSLDAFHSFDKYPEDNAAALYGLPGADLFGHEFPDFDYTSDTS
jgi:hypothetical protein